MLFKTLNYFTFPGVSMTFIPMIQEDKAETELKDCYDKFQEPWGGLDNIMKILSLDDNSLKGHYELYISAMIDTKDLSYKQLKMIGIIVSNENQCHY